MDVAGAGAGAGGGVCIYREDGGDEETRELEKGGDEGEHGDRLVIDLSIGGLVRAVDLAARIWRLYIQRHNCGDGIYTVAGIDDPYRI